MGYPGFRGRARTGREIKNAENLLMAANRNRVIYIDDLRLVRRMRRGDEEAFRGFFDEFYDRLYRFALYRVGNDPCVSEDLVQETLSKAIYRMKSYRGEAQLQTWLFTICRNTIIDFKRKQGLDEKSVVLAEDFPAIRAVLDSFAAPATDDPVASAQNAELSRFIQVALDRLPKRYGDALEWKYIQGWSILEIGDQLNIGKEATQSLIARAKRAFAEVYAELTEPSLPSARNPEIRS